jgi:hypothetical protein
MRACMVTQPRQSVVRQTLTLSMCTSHVSVVDPHSRWSATTAATLITVTMTASTTSSTIHLLPLLLVPVVFQVRCSISAQEGTALLYR